MAGTTTATEAAALFIQTWASTLKEEATEEMKIGSHFASAEGVEKFRNQLNIRKIKVITGQILNGSAASSGKNLTYSNNTEASVSCTPQWAYAAVEINRAVFNRMEISPNNAYRNMLKAALAVIIDASCGQLAASLGTNVKGSGVAQIDKPLLLDVLQSLITSCKGKFKPGSTPVWLTIHPSQVKNLINILDITADYARGGTDKPMISGWVAKALGMNIDESGNVYQAGGVTHNLAHIDDAFVLAYNEEPTVLPAQDFEMVMRVIATAEFGNVEVFDEDACDLQTAA